MFVKNTRGVYSNLILEILYHNNIIVTCHMIITLYRFLKTRVCIFEHPQLN